MYFVENP